MSPLSSPLQTLRTFSLHKPGTIAVTMRDPEETVELTPGQTYSVHARRPHLVTNPGSASATFLVLQGLGTYDFVPVR